jgi:phage-related protein
VSNDLRFSLIGDDRLSSTFSHAGDSALAMVGRLQLAATDADLAMAGLNRDLDNRIRDARGTVLPESEGLGRAIGARIRDSMDEVLAELHPDVEVGADPRPADREVQELAARIRRLQSPQIGIGIDAGEAIREVDEIHADLDQLSRTHADPEVRAQAAAALATLGQVRDEVARLDAQRATIDVDIDAERALTEAEHVHDAVDRLGDDDGPDRASRRFGALGSVVGRVGSMLGSLGGAVAPVASVGAVAGAGIPLVAGLVTWLENVAPAGAIAATGALALGSALGALKIGTSGIGAAISAVFAPATGGGGGGGGGGHAAAAATNAYADAQRNLHDVIEQTAQSNQQAIRGVASAERDLGDAQKAARQAQDDLVQARQDATRQLRDMNDSLDDAKLSERDAVLAVQDAEANLAAVRAKGSAASQEEQDKAQLAVDKALQQLKEQRERVQDLQTDTDKANKAGVAGSQTVRDAQDKVAQTARDVSDRQQAVADAQENVRRTAEQGAEAIDKAREALQQAGAAAGGSGGGGGAAGGINALSRAMAGLSPNARAFVGEIIKLKPALTSLKLDVQQHLFAGLAGQLAVTARTLLPIFRRSLDESADSLNAAGRGAANAADKLGTSGILGRALDGANRGLRNLTDLPGKVVTAIGQLGAAAAPSFDRLTAAVDKAAGKIFDKLNKAFKSGALEQDVDTAVNLLVQFGHTLDNVGKIVGNVLGAAQGIGPGAFGWLNTLTGTLAKVTAEQGVQTALQDLFTVMAEIGKVAGPLLAQALRLVAPVLVALAPAALRLVDSLGAGLQPVITALGPVLLVTAQAVAQLADAVSPLLPVVGQMIAQLGPILTPVIALVGDAFVALAPVLLQLGKDLLPPLAKITGTVVKAFHEGAPVLDKVLQQLGSGGLMPIVGSLATLIGHLVDTYAEQWLTMFEQLLPVVPQLVPVLLQLAESVAQILIALTPLLPSLTQLATQLVTELLPAVLPLLPPLVQMEILFLRLATGAITKVVLPALGLLTKAASGLLHGLEPMISAVTWVTQHVAAAFQWLYDTLLGHSIIPDIVNGTVRWFTGLPGRAASAIASLGSSLAGKARDAGTQLIGAVRNGLDGALGWIGGLPSRAKNTLGDLSGVLYRSGKALIQGFIDGMEHMAKAAAGAAKDVLGAVKDHFPNSPAKTGPFSGKGWTWYSGLAVMDDWTGAMTSRTGHVVDAVGGVVGAAARAVPNRLALPGLGVSPGAAAAVAGRSSGPISITVPGVGGIVMAKEIQGALLALKRTTGINIELNIG